VTALHACKLLRLTRHQVLDIAKHHPEVGERLEASKQARAEAFSH